MTGYANYQKQFTSFCSSSALRPSPELASTKVETPKYTCNYKIYDANNNKYIGFQSIYAR